MPSHYDSQRVEARLKKTNEARDQKRLTNRRPGVIVIDAATFTDQVAGLAVTLTFEIEREGRSVFTNPYVQSDVAATLRQLTWTYNPLRYATVTRLG